VSACPRASPCHAAFLRYFDGGCSVCGGPVAVKFTRSRAVSICRACHHFAIANVHVEDGNLVFEQVVRAAA